MFRTPGNFPTINVNPFDMWISSSGSLLPSHGLPPFGANITNIAMGESLCGTSMFSSERWGVSPMTAGNY